jgi:hypothetical protein
MIGAVYVAVLAAVTAVLGFWHIPVPDLSLLLCREAQLENQGPAHPAPDGKASTIPRPWWTLGISALLERDDPDPSSLIWNLKENPLD